jgi:hypothetical protein
MQSSYCNLRLTSRGKFGLFSIGKEVIQREGAAIVYATGDSIPLTAFGADALAVAEIFAPMA